MKSILLFVSLVLLSNLSFGQNPNMQATDYRSPCDECLIFAGVVDSRVNSKTKQTWNTYRYTNNCTFSVRISWKCNSAGSREIAPGKSEDITEPCQSTGLAHFKCVSATQKTAPKLKATPSSKVINSNPLSSGSGNKNEAKKEYPASEKSVTAPITHSKPTTTKQSPGIEEIMHNIKQMITALERDTINPIIVNEKFLAALANTVSDASMKSQLSKYAQSLHGVQALSNKISYASSLTDFQLEMIAKLTGSSAPDFKTVLVEKLKLEKYLPAGVNTTANDLVYAVFGTNAQHMQASQAKAKEIGEKYNEVANALGLPTVEDMGKALERKLLQIQLRQQKRRKEAEEREKLKMEKLKNEAEILTLLNQETSRLYKNHGKILMLATKACEIVPKSSKHFFCGEAIQRLFYMREWEKCIEACDRYGEYPNIKAYCYKELGNYDEAARLYGQKTGFNITEMNMSWDIMMVGQADLHNKRNQSLLAIELLNLWLDDRAMKIYASPQKEANWIQRKMEVENGLKMRAYTLMKLNRYSEAIKDYNIMIQSKKLSVLDEVTLNKSEALINRGTCKIMLGDTTGAIDDYYTAFQVNPSDTLALYYLMNIYIRNGETQGAIGVLPKLNEARRLNTALQYAIMGDQLFDYEEKGVLYDSALAIDPACIKALWGALNVRYALGEHDIAIQHGLNLFTLRPGYSDVHLELARLYSLRNNMVECEKYLSLYAETEHRDMYNKMSAERDFENFRNSDRYTVLKKKYKP